MVERVMIQLLVQQAMTRLRVKMATIPYTESYLHRIFIARTAKPCRDVIYYVSTIHLLIT